MTRYQQTRMLKRCYKYALYVQKGRGNMMRKERKYIKRNKLIDPGNNTDESQKQDAKRNKPDTKDYILQQFIYMKF